MKTRDLIRASLRHYWRTHLGVALGAACGAAVLVGALAVGDSVRSSLHARAMDRIGRIEAAIITRERFFRDDLADRIEQASAGATLAPALMLPGVARTTGDAPHSAIAQVLGVDGRFFRLSPRGVPRKPPRPGSVHLGRRLARQLGVAVGDTVLVRVEKPSVMPRDMALATIEDISFAVRASVAAILDDGDFGRFGLRASQVPPFNVLLSLRWLQRQLELDGRANLLLAGGLTAERGDEAVRSVWSPADAQLEAAPLERDAGVVELTSDRVFIDDAVVETVAQIVPGAVGVLTYFVNTMRHGARETPYSTVAALGPLEPGAEAASPALAATLALAPSDTGLSINGWLARDLAADVGDDIELTYFVMGPELSLHETAHTLSVRAITALTGAAADPSLMPAFPGLEDAESCRDWEPGIPIQLDRIRDADERYWDDHRGTPKAFVDLATGRRLWRTRFGSLTAIRLPASAATRVEAGLRRTLDPARLGLFFRDVRGPALAGGTSATDFGGLFLGLSIFLIVAALLLTAMLFAFGIEQRASEIGLLLALGFRRRQVRRLVVAEASVLALVGGAVGAAAGILYTRAVLYGLGTLWRGAVGATALELDVRASTLALGFVASVLVAVLAMSMALRRAFARPALELLASRSGVTSAGAAGGATRRTGLVAGAIFAVAAVALVVMAGSGSAQAAGTFFGAGGLLLIATILFCRELLAKIARGSRAPLASVTGLGLRNTGRRLGRSVATIALLATGTFLVAAIQANRIEPPRDPGRRDSGTGGFALFGRSTLPIARDLGEAKGREALGLDDTVLEDTSIVPMRVHEGDDASCLNLGVPQNPRLIGVPAGALADRGAFRFAEALDPPGGAPPGGPWRLLDADWGAGVVPAIGDEASVKWTMKKKVGDDLAYRDEHGESFTVRIVATIANSILQGNLIIAADSFEQRFPSTSGYRMFLVDTPVDGAAEVASGLTRALEDIGLELTPTADRLAAFNAVQNTYLLIFQTLGGLGLLLGTVGLGMVVLRNALERRAELALARALGFPTRAIRWLVWSEHGLLLGLGLLCGAVAALVAVVPGNRAGGISVGPTAWLIVAVAASGAAWVALGSVLATRGPLLDALRDE